MPQAGCVYVLGLTGYRPRPGGPSGLVKVDCSSDVARRASGLSTPEGLAEFLPEATLHPLLYSSAELAALARKRYLPAELVLVSGATPNKYALEKARELDLAAVEMANQSKGENNA